MKMFKRSLVASSIIASLCNTPASLADDLEVQISNSLLDTYTDKYEEADLVVAKLTDIRAAAMTYWTKNEDYPAVINDLVADSVYFGTFTTTFGSRINGVDNDDSYSLTIDLPSPELAGYVASNVNGTFVGNTVTLQFGLPMSAVANNVALSRYEDPANPDLNTMATDIDMDGFDIENAGAITANSAVINGDFVVNNNGNNLTMDSTGLTYNGSEVVTADNIDTYADTENLVSKVEDASMSGSYTIEGDGAGLTMNDSQIKFQEGGIDEYYIKTDSGALAIGNEGRNYLSIAPNHLFYTGAGGGRRRVVIEGGSYTTTARLWLAGGTSGTSASAATLYSPGQETWIGATDTRIDAFDGASRTVNLGVKETGSINMYVGTRSPQNGDRVFLAQTDSNNNAYVSLQYKSEDRLSTTSDGVSVSGGIVANYDSDADGVADTEFFNLSETAFTYNGTDVITAANIATYGATKEDAVSKTEDGVLRGLYTIDGLEADGSTDSGAGISFINGAGINGNLNLKHTNGVPFFTVNAYGQGLGGVGLKYIPAQQNSDVVLKSLGTSMNETELVLDGDQARLRAIGGGAVHIGVTDDRMNAFGGASDTVFIGANNSIKLAVGNSEYSSPGTFVEGYKDGDGNTVASLQYDALERFTTDQEGVNVLGTMQAFYDSNADGTKDTEYFSLSEASFSYHGAEVITTDNIASHDGTGPFDFETIDGNPTITAGGNYSKAINFNVANQSWATSADLEIAGLEASTINAGLIQADDIIVNSTLTVNGVDVGQWIADCEAGVSSGCSTGP